jgi:transcriptional regulator with XRE-family HTH domain
MKRSKADMPEGSTNVRSKSTVIIPLLLFGRFAKSWRRHQKLTQMQMAKRAGVDLHSIQQLEKGVGAGLTVESLFSVADILGMRLKFAPIKRQPPKTPEQVLEFYDRLIETKIALVFYRRIPDREHKEVFWDIVGDPMNNWLYVIVSNPEKKARFGAVTTDPGAWSIASQIFGIDAETHAIAEELSNKLMQKHKSALLG